MPEDQNIDYTKPVAYDKDGQPLYAHPPAQSLTSSQPSHVTAVDPTQPGNNFDPRTRVQYANEPGVRHVTRDIDPPQLPVSDEAAQRSEQSQKQYPFLNLSRGEYVILAVRRHPIGIFIPVVGTAVGIVFVYLLAFMFMDLIASGDVNVADKPSEIGIFGFASLVALLVGIFGYLYIWVYIQNKFFMTNESVIQEIQITPFSKHEQTVSLGSIEDASFVQTNIIQTLFNYGSIRLSTEGEETTYRFHYVANPKKQIATLNNAVESFKNGRPVNDD